MTEEELKILKINISKANEICNRMKNTIKLLEKDEMAYKAFKLMNLAMMKQMMQKQHKEREECLYIALY